MKLEWGSKRTCQGCGVRFYDLQKIPAACPKCGVVFELQTSSRGRRKNAAADAAKEIALGIDEIVLVDDIDHIDGLDSGAESDVDLIEDTSDLGGDLDDLSDVMDHDSEADER
ncbi:MAG: TIGR02300 family protein [Alphaproteobacteria bacterium]|nr:TIGR02300 family protein [Alphaproteobacteria bacterium]